MTADRDLIAEGRELLACVDPELLPLEVDRTYTEADCFVCDRNGLEFATPREADRQTAELIAWLINNTPALLDKLEQLQRGGKYLGDIIVAQNRAALDATGLHHLIDETGDGDWQAVWENVADLGVRLEQLRAERAQELAAIAVKQRRDADRIAELEAIRDRAYGQAESWETATELGDGRPSIVAAAFGQTLRIALDRGTDKASGAA